MRTIPYAALLALILVAPKSVTAQRFITSDTTQEGGTFVVDLPGTLIISDPSNPLLTLTGSAQTTGIRDIYIGSSFVDIGGGDKGQIMVEVGSTLDSHYTFVGYDGTATVSGNGSKWLNGYGLDIAGSGKLSIKQGGLVISDYGFLGGGSGYRALATVTGTGSQWQTSRSLSIYGGKLNVENGGVVTGSQGDIEVGGTATINGDGSHWQISYSSLNEGLLSVNGMLNVENGGVVTSTKGAVGNHLVGTATISGSGSKWQISSDLDLHSGTLSIENGGLVVSAGGEIGTAEGLGIATVTGAGSRWQISNGLLVGGFRGTGTLNIENGGCVTSQSAYLGQFSSNSGTATVKVTGTDSVWKIMGSLSFGLDDDDGVAALIVENGGTVEVAEILTLGIHGTLAGNGGTIIGNVINDGGLISPGNSPGVLTIDGDLTSTGMVKFELAGTGSGLFDQLLVSGNLKLGGVVEIDLLDGFDPAAGNSFNLLDFGSFNNLGYRFDFSHAALKNGRSWDTSMFAVDGTIRVVPETSSLVLAGVGMLAGFIGWRTKNRAA